MITLKNHNPNGRDTNFSVRKMVLCDRARLSDSNLETKQTIL